MFRNTWWDEVSGPRRFIDAAVSTAAAQKSQILSVPAEMPFEEEFFIVLRERLQNEFLGTEVAFVKEDIGDPADYFMRTRCRKDVMTSFRPKPGFTAADFLASTTETSMHGACYIVRAENEAQLDAWKAFVSNYLRGIRKDITPAVFVLYTKGDSSVKNVKGVGVLKYADFVTHFDAYAYCAIRSAGISEPAVIKAYLADLAAAMSKGNVEAAEQAIYVYREFLEDPSGFMIKRKVTACNEDDLVKLQWESQIRCIFPHIEQFRCDFVERHRRLIEPVLPLANPAGETYTKAEDVELGSLQFLAGTRVMSVPKADYEDLCVHAWARNELAHLNVIPYEEIRKMLL